MWIEEKTNKKGLTSYHYYERYKDKHGKTKKACVTLKSNSRIAQNTAIRKLHDKIQALKEKEAKTDDFTHSLGYVANEWLAYTKTTVKYRTHYGHIKRVDKLIAYYGKDTLISSISIASIENMIHMYYYEKDYSYSYAKSILETLKAILKFSKKRKLITDITDLLDVSIKRKPFTLKDLAIKENKFLDHDELTDILYQLKKIDKRIGLAMEFMSRTGLRIGELLALRECDYNEQNKTIHVNGSMVNLLGNKKVTKRDTPKNIYSVRTVTLDTRCVSIIDSFIAQNKVMSWNYKGYKDTGYIFTSSRGYPYDHSYINRTLKKLKCSKNITSHIFRHTHISLLCELGIPLKAIMARVGHNDPRTTLGIYSHVTKASQNEIIEKLNKWG